VPEPLSQKRRVPGAEFVASHLKEQQNGDIPMLAFACLLPLGALLFLLALFLLIFFPDKNSRKQLRP
jgi:di/tricarboxylate transporter